MLSKYLDDDEDINDDMQNIAIMMMMFMMIQEITQFCTAAAVFMAGVFFS